MVILMAANTTQAGMTLVELMIAMTLTVILISGVGSVYLTLKQTAEQVYRLENAQEVLRNAQQLFYRSSLQATHINVTQFAVTFTQAANATACDGSKPLTDFTERYYKVDNDLLCELQSDTQQDIVLLTDLTALEFTLTTDPSIGPTRLTVILSAAGLPESFPELDFADQQQPGVQLEFALKAMLMAWAT